MLWQLFHFPWHLFVWRVPSCGTAGQIASSVARTSPANPAHKVISVSVHIVREIGDKDSKPRWCSQTLTFWSWIKAFFSPSVLSPSSCRPQLLWIIWVAFASSSNLVAIKSAASDTILNFSTRLEIHWHQPIGTNTRGWVSLVMPPATAYVHHLATIATSVSCQLEYYSDACRSEEHHALKSFIL